MIQQLTHPFGGNTLRVYSVRNYVVLAHDPGGKRSWVRWYTNWLGDACREARVSPYGVVFDMRTGELTYATQAVTEALDARENA